MKIRKMATECSKAPQDTQRPQDEHGPYQNPTHPRPQRAKLSLCVPELPPRRSWIEPQRASVLYSCCGLPNLPEGSSFSLLGRCGMARLLIRRGGNFWRYARRVGNQGRTRRRRSIKSSVVPTNGAHGKGGGIDGVKFGFTISG